MPQVYTVQPGDHISGIAARFGFTKYERIWDDPQNADLKALRKNPNVLNPGDTVVIPDLEPKEYQKPVDATHQFVKLEEKLKLRIVLNRLYNKPYADTPCTLLVGAASSDLTSDGSALIEQVIKKADVDGSAKVKDQIQVNGNPVPMERDVAFKIGYLDPVDQESGQLARLANLGYYRGPDSPVDSDEFASAMEEFQCENRLAVDGVCGPATQAKLLSVHGC